MGLNSISPFLLLSACMITVVACDPDIITDFTLPSDLSYLDINATFFTYTGLRNPTGATPPTLHVRSWSYVTKATRMEFPALDGQSVSLAILEFPPGAINPPHTHPRASELLFVVIGSLEVTLIDTKSVPYTQILETGDMFIFPKGLVHLQYNKSHKEPAVAISAFGSASAGSIFVPNSVFGTGIDDVILAKAFKTDVDTVRRIKAGLTNP